MAKPPRDEAKCFSNTYFITTTTDGGRALLQSDRAASIFLTPSFPIETLENFKYMNSSSCRTMSISCLRPGKASPSRERCNSFKGGFSFRARRELSIASEIWQRGYVDHRVRDANDYAQHKEYIRANPVRAHLVDTPEEFRYSSALPGFTLDPAPQGLKPQE